MATRTHAASPSSQASEGPHTSFHHGISYTSYEGNSWGVKFNNSGARVLVDPWLVGDLAFFDQDWLYKGKKRVLGSGVDIAEIMSETDVVVITQYLDDHCHMPTMSQLPRDTPIIANPGAYERLSPLGFTNMKQLDHGQTVEIAGGKLRLTATEGALVGPPWSKRQNGITFREVATSDGQSASLYFEPHCDFTEGSVSKLGKVDVVVSPVQSTLMGAETAAYPLVMGDINLTKLMKLLQPQVLVPLLNSEIDAEGPLNTIVFDRGTVAAAKAQLQQAGIEARVEMPAPPGETLAIAL